jgi:hypothetical protein
LVAQSTVIFGKGRGLLTSKRTSLRFLASG